MKISNIKISKRLRVNEELYDKETGFIDKDLEKCIIDECSETGGLEHIHHLQGRICSVNDVSFMINTGEGKRERGLGVAVVLEAEPWLSYCRMIIEKEIDVVEEGEEYIKRDVFRVVDVEDCTNEILMEVDGSN